MNYILDFTQKAKEDVEFFKKSGNKTILKKINTLIDEILASPFIGTGKPEALKGDFPDYSTALRLLDSK